MDIVKLEFILWCVSTNVTWELPRRQSLPMALRNQLVRGVLFSVGQNYWQEMICGNGLPNINVSYYQEAKGHYLNIRSKTIMVTRMGIRRVWATGIFGSNGMTMGLLGLKITGGLPRPYLTLTTTAKLHIHLTEVRHVPPNKSTELRPVTQF